jgi:hypothetical protein
MNSIIIRKYDVLLCHGEHIPTNNTNSNNNNKNYNNSYSVIYLCAYSTAQHNQTFIYMVNVTAQRLVTESMGKEKKQKPTESVTNREKKNCI